jgi:hypothetical protein
VRLGEERGEGGPDVVQAFVVTGEKPAALGAWRILNEVLVTRTSSPQLAAFAQAVGVVGWQWTRK